MKRFGNGHVLPCHQMLLTMKLTILLLTLALTQASAHVAAQNVTLSGQDIPLKQVFREVGRQTGYAFFYSNGLLTTAHPVTIHVKDMPVREVLRLCFEGQPLSFDVQNTTVFVVARKAAAVLVDTAAPPQLGVFQGKVMSEDGNGIPSATITLKGTHFMWSTKPDGTFVGVIVSGTPGTGKTPVLVFSSVGYVTRELVVGGKKELFVTLKTSVNTLDEIQMTAYSKTSKRFNTGDITTITSEEIARNPVDNVLEALQGRVPGMLVNQQTGATNGGFRVQIRSVNTLLGSSGNGVNLLPGTGGQPLYIVDGVEYPATNSLPEMGPLQGGSQEMQYGSALNFIDPAMIESVNVLKGADATAIYGSRGAFGVILITTKRAKAGNPSLNANVYQGITELGTSPKLMNNKQYLAARENAFANDKLKPGVADYDVNGTWDSTKNTDWHKFFLGDHAPTTKANVSFSGGGQNSNFLIGAFYSTAGNVQLSKGSVRAGGTNFSLNASTNDKKVTVALSGSFSTNADNRVLVDFGGSTINGISVILQAPDAPLPRLPNGQLDWSTGYNSVALLNSIYNNTTNNLLANTTITYTPIRGLSFVAEGGYSYLFTKEFEGLPSTVFNPATNVEAQTQSIIHNYNIRTISADPRIQYERKFWNNLNLEAIAGGSIRDAQTTSNSIQGSGFLNDELLLNPASAKSTNIFTTYTVVPTRYIGAFASVKLRWADKYIVTLNGRRDGSSVFGPAHQFGNFGSVAGAWIVSEEPWFKGLRHVIDFLKFKGSYGLEGASGISPYSYISSYVVNSNGYEGDIGLQPQTLANPYLHWETDKNAEVGVNFEILNGLVNVEGIYYFDKIGDQLTTQPLSSITGFTSFTVNSPALIHTSGLELAVLTHNFRKTNFTWDTKINFTIPRTKLVAYPGIDQMTSNINYVIGKPITGVKLYRYAGVDSATGVYNFYNAKGVKGEYTPILSPTQLNANTDNVAFVDLAPKWYGGILNSFTYKRLSMDFLVSVTDKIGPNFQAYQSYTLGQLNVNYPEAIAAKRWMKPGDKTSVPKATTSFLAFFDQGNFVKSTGAFSNATYARLQNLSVSYLLPRNAVKRIGLTSARLYIAGQNLLTISKYGGLDPENMTPNHLPPLRVFTGGLMVNL